VEQSLPFVPGPTKEELGQCLRSLRLALGWTTEQLAERSGLRVELLDEIEHGLGGLDVDALAAIAEGLGMTPGTILRLCERRVMFRVSDHP
jgi:transcriptional regulator with XRE-family HTH domain